MNKNRRASLPTKCLITIDITHLDNSFEVPDESKPFSTYDTKHLFFFQLEKNNLSKKLYQILRRKKLGSVVRGIAEQKFFIHQIPNQLLILIVVGKK